MKYLAVVLVGLLVAACSSSPRSRADEPSTDPEGVRVQIYQDPRFGGKDCLVFTHDTSYGASIAVVC